MSGRADESREPTFPPLLWGERVAPGVDPMAKAVAASAAGVDAGGVFWAPDPTRLRAALVLAPEEPLAEAMAMVLVAQNGFSDALGALAPPEVAVTWDWPDGLRVNGARAGGLFADSDARDPAATPSWLVLGLEVAFVPEPGDPGDRPDVTALYEEGCVALTPTDLLESWSRHMLVWLNRWRDDGLRPVHDAWIGRAENVGEEIALELADGPRRGLFVGLDEAGALLLKTGERTAAIPLTALLDKPRVWPPAGV